MKKTGILNLSFSNVVLRFYLMMAVVILGGFTGMWWLALLGLPIFLSAILGLSFGNEKTNKKSTKIFKLDTNKESRKAV